MKIAVVGAGALGLYYGALLQKSGNKLHFLLRRDYDAITRRGLQVCSVDGDFHLKPVKGYRSTTAIGPVELVLIGLKTFSNKKMVDLVRPLVGPETMLVTLQNGLGNEELLTGAFPAEQVIGGVAFLCANRGEPGTVHHLGQGAIRIGLAGGGRSQAAEKVAQTFSAAGISCEYVGDLLKTRWEKLVWNIPFNGLCALTGKNVAELLAHAPSRQLINDLMQEVVTAANAQPLTSPIDGPPFIEKMIGATGTMGGYRPSMMIDRLEGRPLELDSIYEKPLERAAATGIETPHIRMLYSLLDLGE
ncbi:MAG: 2-dehydropantoate 2-reductase [Desulfuromonas sp.]|nr:MAG: 2-dehydropantoate 2-reductase [Desulfuromonas sp.]